MSSLQDTVKQMTQPHKGLLAADESTSTAGKRLTSIGVENTEENRRAYREMLFTTEGVEQYVSGVILYEETLYQKTADGTPFVELLTNKGIVPGIKVDTGVRAIGGKNQEETTQGFDDLSERCAKYYADGARFAKWRATYTVDPSNNMPGDLAVELNAISLARYAAICQENNLVPIVEPEVLMDGSFTMEEYAAATTRVQQRVFHWLNEFGVGLDGIILKPNMIIPSSEGGEAWDAQKIAQMTLTVLRECVPATVGGIMFLSGGQTEAQAEESLKAINEQSGDAPWILSFSYGRALQASALSAWGGKQEQMAAGQAAYYERAKSLSSIVK